MTHRSSPFHLPHRHLSDPSHRETYESAHSVVLSIFAAHAQRQQQYLVGARPSDSVFENENDNDNETSRSTSGNPVATTTMTKRSKYRNDQSCTPARVLAGVLESDSQNKNAGQEGEVAAKSPISSREAALSATFVMKMVPFYSRCLIDVSDLSLISVWIAFSSWGNGPPPAPYTEAGVAFCANLFGAGVCYSILYYRQSPSVYVVGYFHRPPRSE